MSNMTLDELRTQFIQAIKTNNPANLKSLNPGAIEQRGGESKPISLTQAETSIVINWLTTDDSTLRSITAFSALNLLDTDSFSNVLEELMNVGPGLFPFTIRFNASEHEFNLSVDDFLLGRGFSYYGKDDPEVNRVLIALEKHRARLNK